MYEQDRSGTGGDVKERWIPNTGEFLLMDPAVTFLSKAGVALDPREASGSSYEVVLVGAKDRYYDATKGASTHGNVYCNSGASFEVALVGGQTIKTLGKLKQGTNGVYYLDEGTDGVYANDGKEFYADGVTGSVGALVNGGTGLFVEKGGDGFVVAGRVDGERGFKLGIRPLNAQMAKPGDDLLLVFALRTARKSEYLSAPATVPASDYIAVYDKKMLWRANLYISDSTNDWNDLHPWNAPPAGGIVGRENPVWGRTVGSAPASWDNTRWGYNEWNRVTDGEASAVRPLAGNVAPNMTAFASVLAAGNGGQVVTYPTFTYIANIASGGNEQDVVAYSYDGYDSPFEYVEKMRQQYAVLGAKRDADTAAGIETNIPSTIELIKAPAGTWGNYAALDNEDLNLKDANQNDNDTKVSELLYSTNNITWGSGALYPYRPGWALGEHLNSSSFPYINDAILGGSAGADCVGFAQKASNHTSNYYKWGTLGVFYYGDSWSSLKIHPYSSRDNGIYSKLIVNSTTSSSVSYTDGQNVQQKYWPDCAMLVPGDCMELWWTTNNGVTPNHIAVVQDVQDSNGDGIIQAEEVHLIEATWDDDELWARIIRSSINIPRTLEFYRIFWLTQRWEIVRLQ